MRVTLWIESYVVGDRGRGFSVGERKRYSVRAADRDLVSRLAITLGDDSLAVDFIDDIYDYGEPVVHFAGVVTGIRFLSVAYSDAQGGAALAGSGQLVAVDRVERREPEMDDPLRGVDGYLVEVDRGPLLPGWYTWLWKTVCLVEARIVPDRANRRRRLAPD